MLAEVEVRASDVSTAMREAIRTPWPPSAVGFRLVDHDGREVLGGQKQTPHPVRAGSAIARPHRFAAACS
jgi:hypothetical protein